MLNRLLGRVASKMTNARNRRLAYKEARIMKQKNEALEKVRRKMEESKEIKAFGDKIAAAQSKLEENARKLKNMRRMYLKAVITHRRKYVNALKMNKVAINAAKNANMPNKMNRIVQMNGKKEATQLTNTNNKVLGSQAPSNVATLKRVNMG